MLITKLCYTEVKSFPKVKSQTGLSSLRASCKHALNQLFPFEGYAIRQPLTQLLKVSVWYHPKESLFGNFSVNYYQNICDRVYFY